MEAEQMKKEALKFAEVQLELAIEKNSDAVIAKVLEEVKKVAPDFVDSAIDHAKPMIQAYMKKVLLEQAEKISEDV